ncbi:(+)-beta-caryophyllene/(+)-caryolan-1-ol synthase [Streptomyces sp. yr375]|uniref:terpene synthase family protein n=1 Tax=Streptomyces sp. yr375 TaxID=1761906 RepID=UPI0008D47CA4|nr:hypothetical protein [Streptomyces sp. yr375]SEP59348.1 (+)-beta-caryophyllene/(+)-caryolan-1-ol synthase [Streptomyces sp. yr375]
MRRAAADHLGLVNDLYSAGIEDPGERYHNLVFVLARQEHLALEDATRQAVRLANGFVHSYLAARDDLAAQLEAVPDAAVRATATEVATAYGTLMRGNLDYHTRAERYRRRRTAHIP